jgi:hypothetical protein
MRPMLLRPIVPAVVFAGLIALPAMAQTPLPASLPPANDTVKGAALLAEARKALGGEDKLAAIKRLEVKAEITQLQANQTLDGDITLQIETPDKYRREEEIFLPGGSVSISRIQALNGAEVWDVTEGGLPGGFGRGGRGGDFRGGGGGRLGGILGGALGGADPNQAQLDPARQAALREQQRRTRATELSRFLVAFLLAPPETPAWVGTAVTPKDEKADVLEFKTADDTITRLFLDINTHVPLMMTYSIPAPRGAQGRQGRGARGEGRGGDGRGGEAGAAPAAPPQAAQPTTMEMYLGDYKADGGVRTPRHVTREINGEIQEEIRIKSVKLNPSFKPNTFTQSK